MFTQSDYIGVERGLAEFRCGRPVVILVFHRALPDLAFTLLVPARL
jgi:hypothetical protein